MENTSGTILLIKDTSPVETIEAIRLGGGGFSVIHAPDDKKAIEALQIEKWIDIILIDFDRFDGKDSIHIAKEILLFHDIPILFLTANTDKETLDKIEHTTSYGFVIKSSDIWVLNASIKMALKLYSAQSELKKKDRILQESEARYRELFDDAPIGYHEIDKNGIVINVNKTELNLLGYNDRSEMMGKDIARFMVQSDELKQELKDKLSGIKNVGHTYRREFKRKNGSVIPVAVCDKLILDSLGRLIGIRSTIQDITDIKNAEITIKKSETKYRNIFENVQDVFYLTDIIGIITEISPSIKRYSGYSAESLIGKSIEIIYNNPDDRKDLLKALAPKGEVIDYEITMKNKSGELFFASVNTHFIYDSAGNPIGVEGSLRDITDRKKNEMQIAGYTEELESLNATKDKFFSIIAHDLRGPFSSILMLAQALAEKVEIFTHDELKQFGSELLKTTNNAYKLLEDLLEWSHIESGHMPFEPAELNCSEQIEQVINLLKPVAENKKITLINRSDSALTVFADIKMLQMAMRNLISNAIKFSFEENNVVIEAAPHAQGVIFSVIDSGVGIPEETVSKLFRLASYVSTSGTKKEKGTGLGLTFCKDIIDKHSGKIWVNSAPGKGTTVSFILPPPKTT